MTDEATSGRIGRYEIARELGRGAMGIVVLARDPRVDRLVAIKTLDPAAASDPHVGAEMKHRFLTEARAAGRLNHPGIVAVLDADEDAAGRAYLVMEYVEGVELKELMRQGLAVPRVLEIVEGIAAALTHAHERGVVHRDIKPANVLVETSGRPKLTDFGVARLGDSTVTQAGQLLGSPAYMAPEQIRGRPVTPATDVFSLAVMTYEMVTGKRPFVGSDLVSTTHAILNEQPDPPTAIASGLPREVDAVIGRALSKEPEKRHESAAAFARALRDAFQPTDTVVVGTAPAPAPVRSPEPKVATGKGGRWVLVALGVLGLLAVIALGAWVAGRGESDAEPGTPAAAVAKAPDEAPARESGPAAAPRDDADDDRRRPRDLWRDVKDTVKGRKGGDDRKEKKRR